MRRSSLRNANTVKNTSMVKNTYIEDIDSEKPTRKKEKHKNKDRIGDQEFEREKEKENVTSNFVDIEEFLEKYIEQEEEEEEDEDEETEEEERLESDDDEENGSEIGAESEAETGGRNEDEEEKKKKKQNDRDRGRDRGRDGDGDGCVQSLADGLSSTDLFFRRGRPQALQERAKKEKAKEKGGERLGESSQRSRSTNSNLPPLAPTSIRRSTRRRESKYNTEAEDKDKTKSKEKRSQDERSQNQSQTKKNNSNPLIMKLRKRYASIVDDPLVKDLTFREFNNILSKETIEYMTLIRPIIRSFYQKRIPRWVSDMKNNYNLLFFGFGCKRALVETFVRDGLRKEGDVITIDGQNATCVLLFLQSLRELIGHYDLPVPLSMNTSDIEGSLTMSAVLALYYSSGSIHGAFGGSYMDPFYNSELEILRNKYQHLLPPTVSMHTRPNLTKQKQIHERSEDIDEDMDMDLSTTISSSNGWNRFQSLLAQDEKERYCFNACSSCPADSMVDSSTSFFANNYLEDKDDGDKRDTRNFSFDNNNNNNNDNHNNNNLNKNANNSKNNHDESNEINGNKTKKNHNQKERHYCYNNVGDTFGSGDNNTSQNNFVRQTKQGATVSKQFYDYLMKGSSSKASISTRTQAGYLSSLFANTNVSNRKSESNTLKTKPKYRPRHLFIVIHSLDSSIFRQNTNNYIIFKMLENLITSPFIHCIASVDHADYPMLLGRLHSSLLSSWTHCHVPTYEPYHAEAYPISLKYTSQRPNLQNGRNSTNLNPNILSVLTNEVEEMMGEVDRGGEKEEVPSTSTSTSSSVKSQTQSPAQERRTSSTSVIEGTRLGYILASLTSRHLDLCKILAEKQWEEYKKYEKMGNGIDNDIDEDNSEDEKRDSDSDSNNERTFKRERKRRRASTSIPKKKKRKRTQFKLEGMLLQDVYNKCKAKLIASTSNQVQSLFRELRDHGLVGEKEDKDGRNFLILTLPLNEIPAVLNYNR